MYPIVDSHVTWVWGLGLRDLLVSNRRFTCYMYVAKFRATVCIAELGKEVCHLVTKFGGRL